MLKPCLKCYIILKSLSSGAKISAIKNTIKENSYICIKCRIMRYFKLLLIIGILSLTSCEKDCMTSDAIIDRYSEMIEDAEGNTVQQMELQAQMQRELENACD